MIQWIRTSRLSIKNSLSLQHLVLGAVEEGFDGEHRDDGQHLFGAREIHRREQNLSRATQRLDGRRLDGQRLDGRAQRLNRRLHM